uniref:Uncharacterized protein n=1 Tax=Arundo donax TaxID=35708 RepID=A0A0A9H2J3_ARUDO
MLKVEVKLLHDPLNMKVDFLHLYKKEVGVTVEMEV